MLPIMPPLSSGPPLPVGGFGPNIAVVGNADLVAAERAAETATRIDREAVTSSLAAHVRRRFEDAKRAKASIEIKLLAALRQRVGQYPPEKLAEIRKMGGSEIFVRLTETKCAAAAAWIRDVLSLDRPWALEPTPVPELSPEQTATIEREIVPAALAALQQQIAMGTLTPEQAQQALAEAVEAAKADAKRQQIKAARERADRMATVIQDYLDESAFKTALADAIDWDLTTFGTAILKAPVIRNRSRLTWQADASGAWTPTEVQETYPDVERVSPLDFYPSDDALSIRDASFCIERFPVSRGDLASFKGLENYNSTEIDAALADYGRDGLREWTSADSDAATLAERTDARETTEKLDALIYWGECQGSLLKEWGIQSVEPLAEYAVEAWLVGTHVVRVEIKEPHQLARPYHKAVYRSRPGSFWGVGLPELIEDIQQQANATARALANNQAMASGPMAGIDMEQLPPDESGTAMWPWKVWRFNTGKYGQAATPPITFFQPDMHANELMAIYERWVRIADDVSGIPAYVYGNSSTGGAGNTASGLSMLMGASTKSIKAVVANLDRGIIEPLIEALFHYAMLYHPDNSIKGDCKAVAKGSTSLMVREQAQIRRTEFLTATNNPADLQIMGLSRRAELLRSTAETLALDPDQIAPTREEMDQQQAAQQQQQQLMQQQAAMAAQPQTGAELGPDGQPVAGQDARLFTPEG